MTHRAPGIARIIAAMRAAGVEGWRGSRCQAGLSVDSDSEVTVHAERLVNGWKNMARLGGDAGRGWLTGYP
uniref:Uncharacterized protein n=1 Tax=Mycena chlorophos TaxID=658473 RepID=A0ABQ0LJA9_MYCCL|nr:predicted protein [Mycena chlorophos]